MFLRVVWLKVFCFSALVYLLDFFLFTVLNHLGVWQVVVIYLVGFGLYFRSYGICHGKRRFFFAGDGFMIFGI